MPLSLTVSISAIPIYSSHILHQVLFATAGTPRKRPRENERFAACAKLVTLLLVVSSRHLLNAVVSSNFHHPFDYCRALPLL